MWNYKNKHKKERRCEIGNLIKALERQDCVSADSLVAMAIVLEI